MTHPTEARLREALEKKAEALFRERWPGKVWGGKTVNRSYWRRRAQAALSQPEGGEEKPVAWRVIIPDHGAWLYDNKAKADQIAWLNEGATVEPLYTRPLPTHDPGKRVNREEIDQLIERLQEREATSRTILRGSLINRDGPEAAALILSTLSDAPCEEEGGLASVDESAAQGTTALRPDSQHSAGGEG